MQIVIAGKAHPKDHPGKSQIRDVVQYSRDPDLWKHIVFIEDYDMKVARELVQGVDSGSTLRGAAKRPAAQAA